jgi:thiol-disulfide isomerase/thioredoxin
MVRWALAGGVTLRATSLLSALLLIVVLSTPLAGAAAPPPLVEYSKAAFTAAQAENRPIVVFVHASWCVTCRRQQPIVQELASDAAFKGKSLVVFVVDYADKGTLKELHVVDRSTLVAFHGKTERARSSFSTDPAEIRALFSSAL